MPILMDFLRRTSKLSHCLYHPFIFFALAVKIVFCSFPMHTVRFFSESVFFCCSTKELFLKFLQRLEADYIPREFEGNLIKDVSTTEFRIIKYE